MATIKTLEYVSRDEAIRRKPEPDTIVISINEPHAGAAPLQSGWRAVHVLHYNTDERPSAHSFTPEMARDLISFVAGHEDVATKVLIHCSHGESRSATVALALDEKYELGLYDGECPGFTHTLSLHHLFDAIFYPNGI